MEDFLSRLSKQYEAHRAGSVGLFCVVLIGALGFVALTSDIGFSDEVRNHRFAFLYVALGFTVTYVAVWKVRLIVRDKNRLKLQLNQLQRKYREQREAYEAATKLAEQRSEHITHLQQMILNHIQPITPDRVIEISNVQFYDGSLHLKLRKNKRKKMNLGDQILVIDKTENALMGVFDVMDISSTHFIAKGSGYIDPIWLGYVHQMGNAESSAPPGSIAISYLEDVNTYE